MFNLRWYQEEGINALLNYNYKQNPLLVYPTGTGKSIIVAEFCKRAMYAYPNTRILMLTHVKELVEQNANKLKAIWETVPLGIFSAGLKQKDTTNPIIFGSMQSVYKHIQKCNEQQIPHFGSIDLLIIDEAHLVSEKDETSYRGIIKALYDINPYIKVIGLTATPYRLKGGMLTDCGIFGEVIYDLSQSDQFIRLIKEGYLAPLIPKRTSVEIDVSNVSVLGNEYNLKQLAQVSDKDEITFNAVREIVEYGTAQNRKAWIIFCTSVEHCEHVNAMLLSMGIASATCHSKLSDKENTANINAFKSGELQCLVNNNKLTTGFDYPDIDLIGMLRPTNSVSLWCLSEDTEVLTENGWRNYNNISVCDKLPCFDLYSQKGAIGCVLNKIKRPLYHDEKMISIENQNLNFMVSDNHNLLISKRKGRSKVYGNYELTKAKNLNTLCDTYKMPTSINLDFKGCGLNKYELGFIGLFMTDGTLDRTNNQITLYQSNKYPYIQKYIDVIFQNLKFPLRKYERVGDLCFGKIRTTPIVRWQVSKKYWGYLERFISKKFAETLQELSVEEFEILLNAINMGDGAKNNYGIYKRKTFEISTGNKTFADNLQRACVVRGYNCKIIKRRYDNVFMIHIKKGNYRTAKPKQDFIVNNYKGDVWCVSTSYNTIVTRRKGIVTVMGNCQMLGRGTRPSLNKENCLVLDFAGNTRRLGCINDPNLPSKRKGGGGTGSAPVKICPECSCYNHTKARVCEVCGAEFAFQSNLLNTASSLELIKDTTPQYEMIEVDQVIYNEHVSKQNIPTLQVTYLCGLMRYYEYICFEHTGYARKRAEMWWQQRSADECPSRVYEVLALANYLKKPSFITVHVNKKYPEIKSVSF